MTKSSTQTGRVQFYDHHPQPAKFSHEVIQGLLQQPRSIPPKFFYDERGAQIFDDICTEPEYYVTRTEMHIIAENMNDIVACVGTGCVLIEPGSGNSQKVRPLLEQLRPKAYIPMDICAHYLRSASAALAQDFPWLEVHATCLDFTRCLTLPEAHRAQRKVAFFPGSSIGNFEPPKAIEFLKMIAQAVQPDGGLLIGVDLKKTSARLQAAYNDKNGTTAAFNINLLHRINRELNANFKPENFRHKAFYNGDLGRIEMHLVSQAQQTVTIDDYQFDFEQDDSIHTENSYKYSIGEFQALAQQAGFESRAVWTDIDHLFSVHYFLCT